MGFYDYQDCKTRFRLFIVFVGATLVVAFFPNRLVTPFNSAHICMQKLVKEQIAQHNSRNHANQIGNEADDNGVANVFDTY